MAPNMSVNEMLNSFIYIVKGSRVIDRKAANWSLLRWMNGSYAKPYVLSMSDLRQYFAHRRSRYRDDLNDWFKHRYRLTAATLSEAMGLADEAAHGLIEVRIDVDAMIAADNRRKDPPWGTPARKAS